ncbi:BTB/POZ domain-containing protein At1g21780-like isoform X4 [Salvia miltiorrhiza]|uniref:BTB/POZ domain-containing protein At1g21780-like isoform X4 n=1 Tax=Salvia miltiorrhiza TaxID=226208 RepID=UPI0025ACBB9D|nr:BTB/POZ domain-containing protein At1g21780-like isoform X4 [Salvia miltiorrhiza]
MSYVHYFTAPHLVFKSKTPHTQWKSSFLSLSHTMADTKVETIARLAQWKIESFGPTNPYKRSDPFKIGIWNWHLSVEKNRSVYIRLFPEPSRLSKEQPPLARFVIRVSTSASNRRPYVSPIHERLLRSSDDFACPIDINFQGRFVIDVEFLDLKICPLNGGEGSSIWPSDGLMQSQASQSTLRCLYRMLDEEIHADVTINLSDGPLRAHRAILSASSPVFLSMFQHDLKEKESSTIDILDMTSESCMALLRYLYGTISQEDFWKHRLALLSAANKYSIIDLKDACEESLLEDINSGNVLERLQEAWLYQLDKLKKGCLVYLLDFGKIYDVREEMNDFFRQADRELVVEMFQELLAVWKPT